MTKLELIAASLTQMCNHSRRCHWFESICPIDNGNCGTVSITDWIDYITNGEKNSSELATAEIRQRLDRIESLLLRQAERQEDPKSLGLFVKDRIKRAAHR